MLQRNESKLQKEAWFYAEVNSGEENFLPFAWLSMNHTDWEQGKGYKWLKNSPLSLDSECVIAEAHIPLSGQWDGIYMVWFQVWAFFHCTKVPSTWQAVSIKKQWECSGYYIKNPNNSVGGEVRVKIQWTCQDFYSQRRLILLCIEVPWG